MLYMAVMRLMTNTWQSPNSKSFYFIYLLNKASIEEVICPNHIL